MQNEYKSDLVNEIRVIKAITSHLLVKVTICQDNMPILKIISCNVGLQIFEGIPINTFKLIQHLRLLHRLRFKHAFLKN